MKKFFTYILIFVTILQLVIPPSSAQAQTPDPEDNYMGFCTITLGGLKQPPKNVTKKTCREEAESSGGLKTWSWYKDTSTIGGGGGGGTPVPPSAVTGCYNTQGQPGPQTDPATCISQGHSWHIKNGSSITSGSPTGCYNAQGQPGPQTDAASCKSTPGNFWYEKPSGTTTNPELNATGSATADPTAPKTPNDDIFGSCQATSYMLISWNVTGCVVRAFHLVFMVIPSQILYITAYIFNAMLALTLGTVLYKNSFLPEAWRIVRDFSNIFFILVLLYISIKMILGLGGAEIKKMIAQVIVAALLINFSMFMTQVVIDASNMLALIFYNKIQVTSQTYTPFISTKNGVQDKDIAGAIASGFNPAKFINPADVKEINNKIVSSGGLFNDLKNIAKDPNTTINPLRPVDGTITNLKIAWAVAKDKLSSGGDEKTLPPSIALAVIFTACGVFLFASYAFFIAGIAFIGRLIELWMLIIFSPFAFMSLSVPKLKGIDYLGWDAWLKRLMNVAFMAPIFMFFLLLISKLVQINIFKGMENIPGNTPITIPHVLVMLIIPAIIYITLLYKAIDFARKGAGELGSKVISFGEGAAKAIGVGALAIGAAVATDGASLALTSTIGKAGSKLAGSSKLKDIAADENATGFQRFKARSLMSLGKFAGESDFDLRKLPGVKGMYKKAGIESKPSELAKSLNLSGSFKDRKTERDKRNKELIEEQSKVGNGEPEAKEVRKLEEERQDAYSERHVEDRDGKDYAPEHLIKEIEKKKVMATEAVNQRQAEYNSVKDGDDKEKAKTALDAFQAATAWKKSLEEQRKALKDAKIFTYTDEKGVLQKLDYSTATSTGGATNEALAESHKEFSDAQAALEAAKTAKEEAPRMAEIATKAATEAATKAATAKTTREEAEKNKANYPNSVEASEKYDAALKAEKEAIEGLKEADNKKAEAIKFETSGADESVENAITRLKFASESKESVKKSIATYGVGKSINTLEDKLIPAAEAARHHVEVRRKRGRADLLANPSKLEKFIMPIVGDTMGQREMTAYEIRQGVKPDEKKH